MTILRSRGNQLRTNLGAGLKQARMSKGMTLRQICSTAAVSFSYWCEVERGETQASFDTLDRMCAALDIDMQALFNYMFKDD